MKFDLDARAAPRLPRTPHYTRHIFVTDAESTVGPVFQISKVAYITSQIKRPQPASLTYNIVVHPGWLLLKGDRDELNEPPFGAGMSFCEACGISRGSFRQRVDSRRVQRLSFEDYNTRDFGELNE